MSNVKTKPRRKTASRRTSVTADRIVAIVELVGYQFHITFQGPFETLELACAFCRGWNESHATSGDIGIDAEAMLASDLEGYFLKNDMYARATDDAIAADPSPW